MIFEDRVDAGRKLADALAGLAGKDGVVLAVPRGGVVVGGEIAKKLGLELDLIIPRKIGAPHNPEVAVGAVTQDGTTILDRRLIEMFGVGRGELEEKITCEIKEIRRRMNLYKGVEEEKNYEGRQLIVVDDGVATGYTMVAALRSARKLNPRELVLAIPVAPPDTLEMLKKEVDRAVCLHTPEVFYAVGQFYRCFDQTEDGEVIGILNELKRIKKSVTPNNTLEYCGGDLNEKGCCC